MTAVDRDATDSGADAPDAGDRLVLARALVAALEAGDAEGADDALEALGVPTESGLYNALGTTAREVHEEIVACASDPALARLVADDAPDVRQRLAHVITLTQSSAMRTLDAVEAARPQTKWLLDAELAPDAHLRAQIIDTALGEILLAQDFQDLTGQLIRRSIGLVESVEQKLVTLLRVASAHGPRAEAIATDISTGHGPAVAAAGDVALGNQQEVDDLLDSLGF